MRLEGVTAELRPRSDWEAIDLGLALVRRDFWKLGAAWWLGMLPALLGVVPLVVTGHPFWALLLFWWWIPVASRLLLFKLSRRLFGDDPGWEELWRELPRAARRRFFFRMLWARLSLWRPLTMPVEDLEGLRRKSYADRVRVLTRRGDSGVMVLALWRIFLSFWVVVALFFTAMLFVPDHSAEGWNETIRLWWEGDFSEVPAGLGTAVLIGSMLSLWLVDMFSTGAGFGIYVNHRTWIEGWDVELAFRRMANRLKGLTAVLLAGWLALGAPGMVATAEEAAPGEVIEEVLKHPDFIVHKKTIKEPVPWKWDWNWNPDWGGGGMMSILANIMKILVIGGLVVLLVWLVYRYRHVFQGKAGSAAKVKRAKAGVVMGMELAPETLPDDVAGTALGLWRSGRSHEALSLLYRGGISWMVHRGGVEIAESDTESDCVRRARSAGVANADYFDGLTGMWMSFAYGRDKPADARFEELCAAWPFGEGGRE